MIQTITILGGHAKTGQPEPVTRIDLRMGDVVSIVGPTGSGKTTFINDIELFADATTPTGRRVLFNGAPPPDEYRDDPARNPIALIDPAHDLSLGPAGGRIPAHPRPHPLPGAGLPPNRH